MANESPQIQAIQARYRQSFPEKKSMIDAYLDNIVNLGQDGNEQAIAQTLQDCHSELHKLAGSFGMYNYQEIASVCRDAMSSVMARDIQLTSDLLQKLSTLIGNEIGEN